MPEPSDDPRSPVGHAPAREVVRALIGRPAWSPRLGIGSFLTLELGEPAPSPPGASSPTRGEYHLWVYCSAWRIDHGTDLLCASEDDRDHIEAVIARLDQRRVVDADVSPTFELTLTTDDGTSLRVFPIFSRGYEHWIVFAPDGNAYTAGPGSTWTVEPQGSAG